MLYIERNLHILDNNFAFANEGAIRTIEFVVGGRLKLTRMILGIIRTSASQTYL
jgi:hypothetical protein